MRGNSKEEEVQRAIPPVPMEVARWLLAYEIGEQQSSAALVAAGERAYLQLRERLAVLLGSTGFDALWARAIHLAQREFNPEEGTTIAESLPTHANGFHAALRGHNPTVVHQHLIVVFASFITLLFTFIGEELGLRFIRQIWPNLLPHAAESQAEGTTP